MVLVNSVKQLKDIEDSIAFLDETLDHIEYAMSSAYDEAIDKSLPYAPEGYTRWQLRGHAQKTAQVAIDKLTEQHNLPRYELPAIRWKGFLNIPVAAGEATNCYKDGRGTPLHADYRGHITLNEILFLRNYEEFIYIIIPHEVAHIFTCLNGGFVYDDNETDWQAEHGPEWEQSMKDLGFLDPSNFSTHDLDLHPIFDYRDSLYKQLGEALYAPKK